MNIYKEKSFGLRLMMIADLITVTISLSLAYFVRAQFSFFLMDTQDLFRILPWIIGLRLGTNFFFEHYSNSLIRLDTRDLNTLLRHCLVPTIFMLFVRYFTPFQILKMPISMIGLEYSFSVLGFVSSRLIMQNLFLKQAKIKASYHVRILIYGEVQHIIEKLNLDAMMVKYQCEIIGILTSNAMHWQKEVQHVRILGDESFLPEILTADNQIAEIRLVNPEELSRRRFKRILELAKKLNMKVCNLQGSPVPKDFLHVKNISKLHDRAYDIITE